MASDKMASVEQNPTARMLSLAAGFGIFQALYAAAKLGIADALAEGPKSVDAIAATTDVQPRALHRLLRALASVGVFAEEDDGVFRNTPLSAMLMSNVPGSLRAFFNLAGSPECWRSWGDLLYSIKSGKPAFEHVYGVPLFEYLAKNPEPARIFDDAMASRSAAEIAAVLAAYDFSECGHLVDVGGGNGALLLAILKAYPQLKGTVFDLPHVTDAAQGSNPSAERLCFAAGDFFSEVTVAGDTFILKKIIHDWPDDRAEQILRRCRDAMSPRSRLLLVELIVPRDEAATFTKFLDLWMMVWPGGQERTAEEYRGLLKSAGLVVSRIVPTASPVSVIEAVPV
ncbi:MAG TPA: methyltransferase [Pseudolabrys sp.]|nr:methyltransferase [Pseudolabrys sp.]